MQKNFPKKQTETVKSNYLIAQIKYDLVLVEKALNEMKSLVLYLETNAEYIEKKTIQ